MSLPRKTVSGDIRSSLVERASTAWCWLAVTGSFSFLASHTMFVARIADAYLDLHQAAAGAKRPRCLRELKGLSGRGLGRGIATCNSMSPKKRSTSLTRLCHKPRTLNSLSRLRAARGEGESHLAWRCANPIAEVGEGNVAHSPREVPLQALPALEIVVLEFRGL